MRQVQNTHVPLAVLHTQSMQHKKTPNFFEAQTVHGCCKGRMLYLWSWLRDLPGPMQNVFKTNRFRCCENDSEKDHALGILLLSYDGLKYEVARYRTCPSLPNNFVIPMAADKALR